MKEATILMACMSIGMTACTGIFMPKNDVSSTSNTRKAESPDAVLQLAPNFTPEDLKASRRADPLPINKIRSGMHKSEVLPMFPSSEETPVLFPNGTPTGLTFTDYVGYLSHDTRLKNQKEPVSLVFVSDKYVFSVPLENKDAEEYIFTLLMEYLAKNEGLGFQNAQLLTWSKRLQNLELDGNSKQQLLAFVKWQSERVENRQATQSEYEYLLAEKLAKIAAEQRESLWRQKLASYAKSRVAIENAQLESAELHAAETRKSNNLMAIFQSVNLMKQSNRPVPFIVNCNTRGLADSYHTTCY